MKNYNPGAAGAPRPPVNAQAAWEAQLRRQRVKALQDEFASMGAPVEGLGAMAAQADTLLHNPRGMEAGGAEHRLYLAAKSANDRLYKPRRNSNDPAGNAVRKLLPGSQAPVPTTWLPGYGYVPSDSPVVKQIEQGMEIQQGMLDLEREKLAMEREQMERQTGVGADLRGWLAKKLGGAQ